MLVALAGERYSGKDTVAEYLVKNYGYQHFKFAGKLKRMVEILFELPDNYDWDKEKNIPLDEFYGHSKRKILQWYGTDGFPEDVANITKFKGSLLRDLYHVVYGVTNRKLVTEYIVYEIALLDEVLLTGGFRNKLSKSFWVDNLLTNNQLDRLYNYPEGCNYVISDLRFPDTEGEFVHETNGKIIYIERENVTREKTNHESEQYLGELFNASWMRLDNNGTLESLYKQIDTMMEDLQYVSRAIIHR